MAKPSTKCLLVLFISVICAKAFDDIDLELGYGIMGKLLRAMENQTKSDTLNLPANASSIRENITDTFSCENRTYGYYADVDNDCQIFHVCLPTQTASGRSITYRWSFICPNETVFNQEVLVCTRPRDAIDCADSPNYYDLNMEIGKETNDTKSETNDKEMTNTENMTNTDTNKDSEMVNQQIKERNRERIKQHRRKPANKRKQNLIAQSLLQEVVKEVEKEDVADKNMELPYMNPEIIEIEPKIENVNDEVGTVDNTEEDFENARLFAERSLKTKGRKLKRGLFRFKADV
ncbi:uncharacterized protein LOC125238790 [Leguminivora glycinivorella]|uniref:uncharacterized protein LOC125238790 n=1 Tax=Leguminivora glycinivorella TaxID=1035111 RepID=UPI00200C6CCB|nr:uncharacterized protein LOC125238790 [Leguminivora glycinivorella]